MPYPFDPLTAVQVSDLWKLVVNRRSGVAGLQVEQITDKLGRQVPVIAGQFIADTTLKANSGLGVTLAQQNFGYAPAQPILGGGLAVFTVSAPPPGGTGSLLSALTKAGHKVSPNAAIPAGMAALGIVWKAHSTPQAALPPGPYKVVPVAGKPVPVVVIDTGVVGVGRTDHWLDGLQTAYNADPLDVFPLHPYLDLAAGHGTFVSGIIRREAPGAQLKVVRALDSDGLADDAIVAAALLAEVKGGARIINLSCGTSTADDTPPPAITAALQQVSDYLTAIGGEVVIVAAGGNAGDSQKVYPAACADLPHVTVLGVGALDGAGSPADFSSYGDWIDFSTLGVDVVSTYVPGTEDPTIDNPPVTFGTNAWASWSGTSFSAPRVAARLAALAQQNGGDLLAAVASLRGLGIDKNDGHGCRLT